MNKKIRKPRNLNNFKIIRTDKPKDIWVNQYINNNLAESYRSKDLKRLAEWLHSVALWIEHNENI